MITYVFPPEMMYERERQLVLALLNSAGAVYDVNYTQNKILGTPLQIVDGKLYDILGAIGKKNGCTHSEYVEYWAERLPEGEKKSFEDFSDNAKTIAKYEAGERELEHQFWTYDVLGNSMLAKQNVRLYQDCCTGDVLGLVYVTNNNFIDALQKREDLLEAQYKEAMDEVAALESVGANIPGGYHRCEVTGGFKLQFVSDSFLEVVGWTREQLEEELDNDYIQLVAPEDRDFFMSHEPELIREGRVSLAYRIVRRDGSRRWIQDSTKRWEKDGRVNYQCTLADITEYVEKMNEEKARAEASSQAKSIFLFNASHDIRTPMNAIQGFAHIIEKNYDKPEVVKETIQKLIQSGDTLMNLLNDVLELSRIERGKDEIEEQPLNMEEHAHKLYEMFSEEMNQAGLEFVMENRILHPYVMGDDLKLTRMAINLLSNAKKFTASGGKVTFGIYEKVATNEKVTYCLFVRDTGIGMSQEFQNRAFEQFERERSSTESGVFGSGLGLAIIKKICDLLGGQCIIDSELGKGSEITISVPLKLVQKDLIQENETLVHKDFSGKRILLVEDNEFNREIARYVLEDLEFEVEEAENGSICVDKVLKAQPGYYDLILMDIQMPVMDGYTATNEIRNIDNKEIAQIPIIAMTANAFLEDKQKCLDVGMNAHIGKPLEVKNLLQELSKVF